MAWTPRQYLVACADLERNEHMSNTAYATVEAFDNMLAVLNATLDYLGPACADEPEQSAIVADITAAIAKAEGR